MRRQILQSTEAQPGRRADAAHGWTYAALRALAALLAAGALFFGGMAIAYADAVSFFDKWVGHDRTMQLSPDGTGTLTLGDGALNTDQWGVTWKQNPSDSITITLASLVARTGPGMGNVGDQYIATIQPNSDGQQLLYMHPVGPQGQVISFCTEAEQAANSPCGA